MQFDRTTISIRERPFADLLDLALRVIWTRPGPWLLMLLIGAVPCGIFNAWWTYDGVSQSINNGEEPIATLLWYVPLMLWQIPIATAPLTLYLGEALFSRQWSGQQLRRDLWRSLPQLLVLQFLMRGVLVVCCVTTFLLVIVWPHLNEIILLERNPLMPKEGNPITTMKRNSTLHTQGSGALMGRWLASAVAGVLLIVSLWIGTVWLRAILLGTMAFDTWFYVVQFQIAVWLTVGYFTVVRFLGYLDLRIRNEGWEAELLLRAEANRMATRVS